MLKTFRADLHIHTCLSPCADLTMSPKRVVEKALEKGIDIIAITDHNSAENTGAAIKAGHDKNITVLAGMEVSSLEEVHIVALYDNAEQIMKLQETVYENLPDEENNEKLFGQQIIANEFDEVEGYNRKLLISATEIPLNEVVREIHKTGGIALAAHIDRESYSIIGQLGFIPRELELDALEISPNIDYEKAVEKFPQIKDFPIITSSDSHYLEDIGRVLTSLVIAEPTINEILLALGKEKNRNFSAGV